MASLETTLRSALEKAVIVAREEAEGAARAAMNILAVNQQRAFESLTSEQKALRNALRAKARHLGSGSQSAGFDLLVEEVAYVQWHRMLFPMFLAENELLMHPTGVAVSLDECEELAAEEGNPDRWATAAQYAGNMLPGIFPSDDPSGQVTFAPEGHAALEAILSTLPAPVFTSDDGLGWVYQFWQSKKKKKVSGSGRKIEKLDLAAYSQLFTEDYMVRFLLENSLGAWWAARHPDSPLIKGFKYLRFQGDGRPAAGAFTGWPKIAGDVTVMDPCCGSGHFLVVAFEMLRRMRMEEEGLGETEAADAVLRDNLFGLEIDPRCVQIAAFALALSAWKVGGYRELPTLNLACSGIAVRGQIDAWTKLSGDDANMRQTLGRLHGLFVNGPDLGSLVDPMNVPVQERMFTPDFGKVAPLLEGALAKESADDPVAAIFGSAALGAARAAELLARQYTLVATNVPYLARGKQGDVLKDFIEQHYEEARADLATSFMVRAGAFCMPGGTYAVVTPQNWLFLKRYTRLRESSLAQDTWKAVIKLGEHAFASSAAAGAFTAVLIVDKVAPSPTNEFVGLDVSEGTAPEAKSRQLLESSLMSVKQGSVLVNPDAIVSFVPIDRDNVLGKFAYVRGGITTGDSPRFRRFFWELILPRAAWTPEQLTVSEPTLYGGRECVIFWEDGSGTLAGRTQGAGATIAGREAWGRKGIAISYTRGLAATLYTGEIFENVICVAVPKDVTHLPALWAFCSSREFPTCVRQVNQKLSVDVRYFEKVPFDLDYWQVTAKSTGPIPEPFSENPTQWLFRGDPRDSSEPLQVVMGRLLGYQWPEGKADDLSSLAIADGILSLSPVVGQEPSSERLRNILAAAYGERWSAGHQAELLRHVGFADKGLDAWLRDGFFNQHCKLFHQHPFIWHVWDGRRDGFSALVNYHKLDAANLDRLIYTYLGEWIRTQRAAEESSTPGASARLVAALELQRKLEAIRDGEPPYDIYVRWKPLHEQPIGWNPDLNDGVRLNIRPFVTAGVLRSRVNVNWKKDRGRDLDGSERVNDMHFTLAQKRAAREAKTE